MPAKTYQDARERLQAAQSNTNPYYVKMSLQLYQVDYKSFLLDFKSVPNVSNPQVSQVSIEKRNSLTGTIANGSAKNDTNSDNLGGGGDKENVQETVNGCDSNENGKKFNKIYEHTHTQYHKALKIF